VMEGERLPYLGMTIMKNNKDFEIDMMTYIEETIQLHSKRIREYVVPAVQALFNVKESKPADDKMKFHSIVAKLLYLGKQGRPDVLMPVQFLCTGVKAPTVEDIQKLERLLGYLQLSKSWTRVIDNSSFEQVITYIDASFARHVDG